MTAKNSSIVIIKATQSDVQAIFDIRCRAILKKCSGFYSAEQLALWTQGGVSEAFLQDIVNTFYVSESDGRVLGSGKLDTETGKVDAIFVDPDFSGGGAAKLMLSFLEALAKQQGLAMLSLDSTLNAAPFYRACGFVGERVATYHSPKGISLECIPMEKVLTTTLGSLAT